MTALLRLLRVRPEEGRVVARFAGLMVVLWSAFAIGGNAVESLLLARVGAETLPTMYMLLGAATFAFMLVSGRISAADPRRMVPAVYAAMAVALAALRLLFQWDSPWAFRVAWLAMMILWTLAGLIGWSLAGALHDTRQAKRLFPLYSAGLVVGLVVGGFLTGPLASALGSEQLVFVWAGGTLAAAWIARAAARAGAGPGRSNGPPAREAPPGFADGARAVARSGLLRWMALALGLFALLFFALTFLFARAAVARYPDPDRLAGFFGLFSGAASGTALAVCLVLANRLFARIGTVNAVLVLPALYLVGFGGLVFAAPFALLVAMRFAQIVWVNGVWAPGWQSMFNVVPASRRPAVRAFMDAVPLQLGVVAAGALLIVAEEALTPRTLAALAAAGAAVAVVAMLRARTGYVRALADALREGYPEVFTTEGTLSGAPERQAIDAAVAASSDPDPGLRRLAVDLLARANGSASASAVRAAVEARLGDEDPGIRAVAAAALAASGDPRGDETLRTMVSASASGSAQERAAAAGVLADAGWRASHALPLADDPDPRVRAGAVAALGNGPADDAIPLLLERLDDPDVVVRSAAARALGRLGEPAVEALMYLLDDPTREDAALDALHSLPWGDPDPLLPYARSRARAAARFAALAGAVGARAEEGARRPDERTELLVAALDERARRGLRLALRAMGRGRPDAVRPAIDNLWRSDPDQRANAIEIVDAALPPQVARLLVGVWEAESTPVTELAALEELLGDPDPWVRACAAGAVAASAHTERLAPGLQRMAGSDPEGFVREAAELALGGGPAMQTLATQSVMDRAMSLRRVPMFAELESADLHSVAEAATEHAFEDGEVIGREGEPGDSLHVVLSGEVAVVVGGMPAGREVAVRRAGEHVGEMSLIGDEPRMASLIARGQVRTLGLDRARFERIVRERPAVALAVIRVLGDRLRESAAAQATAETAT